MDKLIANMVKFRLHNEVPSCKTDSSKTSRPVAVIFKPTNMTAMTMGLNYRLDSC